MSMISRRHFGIAGLGLIGGAGLVPTGLLAQTQDRQARQLKLVVPFPGGVLDMMTREVGAVMAASLAQTLVVENKPGASGMVAVAEVLGRPADGQTLLLGHIGTHAINPAIFGKLNYRPQEDFLPVSLLASTPIVLLVSAALPVRNLKELQAYAKSHPDGLNYGSPGVGSSGHLAGELLKQKAGIAMTHVPYKGASQAMQDLLGGQVQLSVDTLSGALPQLAGGKIRAIALAARQRSLLAPDLATLEEQGVALDMGPWFGLFARSGTPAAEVQRLAHAAQQALQQPELAERLRSRGLLLVGNTPAEFTGFVQVEAQRWAAVARAAGIKPE
ncbi:MAG: tripartite tricarboxylate transporter substrate binding protein [Burkholderiaceae bacterium]|nr:tripartite tricarboxylate transporter substrate binding protein [Burkholderiaceae bacterium]